MKNRNKEHQQPRGEDHHDQNEVARRAYELYREDIEIGPNQRRASSTGAIA